MCVTRPAEVIAARTDGKPAALVSWQGRVMAVDTSLVGAVQPGDRLLVHAGLALERVTADEQASLDQFFAELNGAVDDALTTSTTPRQETP